MPREPRVVAVGEPHHITQRGNARQDVFLTDPIRRAYLQLLAEHAAASRLRILAYCLMTNHVHLVATPETENAMANTFRHAHGRFSQYWNTERHRTGHLWQNRFYSCPLEDAIAGKVIAYVEMNPVRAGMVRRAQDFEWSSAAAHTGLIAAERILDQEWWQPRWSPVEWGAILAEKGVSEDELREIRRATYTGRPFGSKHFTAELEARLGRVLGLRPGGKAKRASDHDGDQLGLWAAE
jgi:putative transposase